MRTKRSVLLSVVIATVVLGVAATVAAFAWPRGGPVSTQIAIITSLGGDGQIEWDQARFVRDAQTHKTFAEPLPGTHHVGQLSDDAMFFVALGENGIVLDASGVGVSPLSRDRFLAMGPNNLYAVQLTVQGDTISKIAEFYHPDGTVHRATP